MRSTSVRRLALSAAVAGIYAALTMVLAPLSYGPLQLRLAELLSILPYFFPYTAWGLFLGCGVANGLSQYGILDVICGSFATLLAGKLVAKLGESWRKGAKNEPPSRKSCVLSCLVPVVFNAVTVGGISVLSAGGNAGARAWLFALNAGSVALSESVVLLGLGLPLMRLLPRQSLFRELSDRSKGESL